MLQTPLNVALQFLSKKLQCNKTATPGTASENSFDTVDNLADNLLVFTPSKSVGIHLLLVTTCNSLKKAVNFVHLTFTHKMTKTICKHTSKYAFCFRKK